MWRQAYDDRRRAKDAAREAEEEALAAEVTQLSMNSSIQSHRQSNSFCVAAALGRCRLTLWHVCNLPCTCGVKVSILWCTIEVGILLVIA